MRIRLSASRKDLYWGIGSGILGLLLCGWVCGSLTMGLLFAALIAAVCVVKIRIENGFLCLLSLLGIAVCSAALNFLLGQLCMELIQYLEHIGLAGKMKYVWNLMCYLVIIGVCYGLTLNVKISSAVTFFLTLLLASVNYYVVIFRGRELRPADIFAMQTVANVIDNYELTLNRSMIYSWFGALVWHLFLFRSVDIRNIAVKTVHKWLLRGAALAAAAACAVTIAVASPQYLRRTQWTDQGSEFNGFLLHFVTQTVALTKPEGYDSLDMTQLEEQFPQQADTGRRPNVIVIMNESFADLRVYNGSLNTNVPVTPFYDALTENAVKGYALASIYGGGTSNSEYELLTGNTMGFLPDGANGYQQYIKEDTYTLNSYFRSLGYHTVAMHPHWANGWMRSTVWPMMKFDEIYFRDDSNYFGTELVREFVGDRPMYDRILKELKDEDEGKPLFLFGVTMQNHGSYEYEDYPNTVVHEGYSKPDPFANQYLTLLRESDQALEYLISELSELDEEVVVLFYGDHQPKVERDFLEELNGGELEDLNAQQKMYTVPFMVWANYDIAEAEVEMTSLNYLGGYLLEAAGLPLPSYVRYLRELEKIIPAINLFGYRSNSAEGGYSTFEDAQGAEKEALALYRCLQYHSIKGGKNRSQMFFPSAE